MRPRTPLRSEDPILVCHSHLRWDWVYQRPQHLLSRLARHASVIVEEEPVFDDRPPGLDALHVAPGVTLLAPPRGAPSSGPPAAPAPTSTSAPGSRRTSPPPAAAARWSAGSTRPC